MEKVGGRMYQPVQRFGPETTHEDFLPAYDWAQDSDGHILLIEIPGFTKEDVTVQLDNYGNLTIGGQRRVSDSRYRRFKQVFGVPEDVNYERISARFDGGLLYIILPKIWPAIKEEQKDGREGRGKAEQEQKDKSQLSEERTEGIRERAGGQERAKEEKKEKVGGEEERKEEKRDTVEQEGKRRGEKRNEVGEEAQRKEKNRDKIEEEGETRQEKKEQVGATRQEKKGRKRVKFGGEETIDKGQDTRQHVDEEMKPMEEEEEVGREETGEEKRGILNGEATKKEKIGGQGDEVNEEKREKIGGQMGLRKDGRTVAGGGEIGGRRVEGRENESRRERESVVRGSGDGENAEGSTGGMGLRRIWESAGWRRALECETVGEVLQTMKKNKVAVASALIALSAGLYLSNRFKTAGD
ncbi:RESTRICTED TEV MOVEMENT 2 protein [Nymphaea thermarum]|nr:RESTRICTED TEV MOVEMENT 2 protein [Nymphaea thermarum]